MRIGILTFHSGFNYGAFFQAYSLQKAISDLGHDCYIIDYKNFRHTYLEYRAALVSKDILTFPDRLLRVFKFITAQKNLRRTKRYFTIEGTALNQFDVIVFGSDEIWNLDNCLMGVDDVYFGKGVELPKRVSYAASFGSFSNGSDTLPREYVNYLGAFSFLSVRDNNSLHILNTSITGNSELVPDPTFLYDVLEKRQFPQRLQGVRYLALYATEISDHLKEDIIAFSREKKIKIVAIGYGKEWADMNLVNLGPFEFLGAISNATFIFTNMFHGTIFSILSEKQFCIELSGYRQNKFFPMLTRLQVYDRIYGEHLSVMLEKPVDYTKVGPCVKTYAKTGIDFLSEALGGEST